MSADLQAILAHPGTDASAKQQSIRARLAAMVTRFEGTHPDLTVTMMQVIQGLGDMGI